jgi:squalene-hopene/tetraprenyl-beta-curcumene cyclase
MTTRTLLFAALLGAAVPSIPLFAADGARIAAPQPAAAQRAQQLIDKGIDFLKSKQLPDGGWATAQQPVGITAIALRAIAMDPKYSARDEFLKKGYDRLLSFQLDNGGIYKDLLANYNTAIAVSALAASEDPSHKPAMDKALAYLKALQWTENSPEGGPKGEGKVTADNPWYGGAGYGRHGRPDGSNTQLMLDALHDAGLKGDDPALKAALKFVTRMQNLSETNDQPWAGDDGGAVYTPANKGESMAGEITGPDGKRRLRSYGSMTYAVLKSYIYAGLSKDDPRVKAAWDWISKNWTLDENPGMAAFKPESAKEGLYYYYMTMGRALDAYNQPIITDAQGRKHDWRLELIDKLASLQKEDGSWTGEKRWQEDNPVVVTSYVLLALHAIQNDLKENPPK